MTTQWTIAQKNLDKVIQDFAELGNALEWQFMASGVSRMSDDMKIKLCSSSSRSHQEWWLAARAAHRTPSPSSANPLYLFHAFSHPLYDVTMPTVWRILEWGCEGSLFSSISSRTPPPPLHGAMTPEGLNPTLLPKRAAELREEDRRRRGRPSLRWEDCEERCEEGRRGGRLEEEDKRQRRVETTISWGGE